MSTSDVSTQVQSADGGEIVKERMRDKATSSDDSNAADEGRVSPDSTRDVKPPPVLEVGAAGDAAQPRRMRVRSFPFPKILRLMDALRHDDKFCDLYIECDAVKSEPAEEGAELEEGEIGKKKKLGAHSVVLAAVCPKLMSSGLEFEVDSDGRKVLPVSGLSQAVVEKVLSYAYGKSITIDSQAIKEELKAAAKQLQLEDLESACERYEKPAREPPAAGKGGRAGDRDREAPARRQRRRGPSGGAVGAGSQRVVSSRRRTRSAGAGPPNAADSTAAVKQPQRAERANRRRERPDTSGGSVHSREHSPVTDDELHIARGGGNYRIVIQGSSLLRFIRWRQVPGCFISSMETGLIENTKHFIEMSRFKQASKIYVQIGSNDLDEMGLSPDEVVSHIGELVAQVHEQYPDARVFISELLPRMKPIRNDYNLRAREVNTKLRDSADDMNFRLVTHPMVSMNDPLLFQPDGIHLSKSGQQAYMRGLRGSLRLRRYVDGEGIIRVIPTRMGMSALPPPVEARGRRLSGPVDRNGRRGPPPVGARGSRFSDERRVEEPRRRRRVVQPVPRPMAYARSRTTRNSGGGGGGRRGGGGGTSDDGKSLSDRPEDEVAAAGGGRD